MWTGLHFLRLWGLNAKFPYQIFVNFYPIFFPSLENYFWDFYATVINSIDIEGHLNREQTMVGAKNDSA